MLRVYAMSQAEKLERHIFERFLSLLDVEKQNRILRFRRWQDAQRSLLGDILVRAVICQQLQCSNRELVFSKNKAEKPFIKNSSQLHFNLSHAGEWVVVALDSSPVGIDVERVRSLDGDIAKFILSPRDYQELTSKKESERASFFYELWTMQESYIKYMGKGLSIPAPPISNLIQQACFKKYNLHPQYKLSVCAEHERFPERIIYRQVEDLYSYEFVLLKNMIGR